MSTDHNAVYAKTCYGCDIADGFIAVSRASRHRKGVRVDEVYTGSQVSENIPLDDALTAVYAELAASRAIAAVALPAGSAFTRWLRTPFASRRKAARVFPTLLDIQLPFPLEECESLFLDAARDDVGHVRTLAASARRQDIRARLEQCERWQLDPERLDHEGLALWTQSIQELSPEPGAARMVAYLGHDHWTLVAGRGAQFQAARGVRLGLRDVISDSDAATLKRHAPALDAFVRRAQQMWQTLQEQAGPTRVQWAWTGPGAEHADLIVELEARLSELNADFAHHAHPTYFLARALARRGVKADALPSNFRAGSFTHPNTNQHRRRQRHAAAAVMLVTGIICLAASLAWNGLITHREQALQQRISELAGQLAGMAPGAVPRGQETLVVERALADRAEQVRPFLASFEPSLTGTLTAIVKTAAAHGLFLEGLSLRPADIRLRGTTDDWNRCAGLEHQLKRLGFEVTVTLNDAGEDELVHFSMQGTHGS